MIWLKELYGGLGHFAYPRAIQLRVSDYDWSYYTIMQCMRRYCAHYCYFAKEAQLKFSNYVRISIIY